VLTVTNNSEYEATGVVVTDTLPPGVTYISDSHKVGVDGGKVKFELDSLPPGSTELRITVQAPDEPPVNALTNVATVVTNGSDDPNGSNDISNPPVVTAVKPKTEPDHPYLEELRETIRGRIMILTGADDTELQASTLPTPLTDVPLPNADFPLGFFGLEVDIPNAGDATTVEMTLPPGIDINTYYKYGPTPDNLAPHFYQFLYDGTTGAELFDDDGDGTNDRIVLHFVDGQRGDHDLIVNGMIVDPGAPALAAPDLALTKTDAPDPVSAGQDLTYTLSVTNNGPGTAKGVVLTD